MAQNFRLFTQYGIRGKRDTRWNENDPSIDKTSNAWYPLTFKYNNRNVNTRGDDESIKDFCKRSIQEWRQVSKINFPFIGTMTDLWNDQSTPYWVKDAMFHILGVLYEMSLSERGVLLAQKDTTIRELSDEIMDMETKLKEFEKVENNHNEIMNKLNEIATKKEMKSMLSTSTNQQNRNLSKDFTRVKDSITKNNYKTALLNETKERDKQIIALTNEKQKNMKQIKTLQNQNRVYKYRLKSYRLLMKKRGFLFIRQKNVLSLRQYYQRIQFLQVYLGTLFTPAQSMYNTKARIKLVDSDPRAAQLKWDSDWKSFLEIQHKMAKKDRLNETKV